MPKGKRFIDKKHSTTFVLTHRSQRDPLIADETAPQNILLPLDEVPTRGGEGQRGREVRDGGITKRKEEERKYGIYFDDDYDYLQHLKDSKEVSQIQWDFCERVYAPQPPKAAPFEVIESQGESAVVKKDDLKDKLKLPSSVFESDYMEDIGLLNKAAPSKGPRPDLDPEVVAALDDDFDFDNPENQLEDNFIQLANQGCTSGVGEEPTAEDMEGLFSSDEEEDGGRKEEDEDYEDEMADSVGSLEGPHRYRDISDDEDEHKSRFTNYSMSSSVVRRNKQLVLVDDHFEKMFETYDDTEIGALDCDEIEGHLNPDSDLLLKYAKEFEEERKKEELVNEKITNLALREEGESDSNDEDLTDSADENRQREKWDCESILSTYSNTKNRPKMISEPSKKNQIRISGRTGMPVGVLGKGLTKNNLKAMDDEYASQYNNIPTSRAKSLLSGATSVRTKEETPEQRKERKQLVKEYRKERRVEKKANTEAFKDEKKRLEKVRLNDRHNVPALKL